MEHRDGTAAWQTGLPLFRSFQEKRSPIGTLPSSNFLRGHSLIAQSKLKLGIGELHMYTSIHT